MTAPVQFSVWLVGTPPATAGGGNVYDADGSPDYARHVTVDVPVGTSYHVYVYYRATSGDPWSVYGIAPGTVNVVQAITVTSPATATDVARGTDLTVAWTPGYAHDCAGAVQRLAGGTAPATTGAAPSTTPTGLRTTRVRSPSMCPSATTTTSTSTTAPPAATPGASTGSPPAR